MTSNSSAQINAHGVSIAWQRFGNSRWMTFLALVGAAVYLLQFVLHNWMPHDEGTLSHLAERVYHGEVSHRDFEDAYTGGLTYLNSLAFRSLGVKLSSIRWFLYFASLPWIACVYWLAARRAPRWMAALLTLMAVVWSLPNYFAALPSWHLLILGTFGIAATLRFVDTNRLRWLVLAGVCGGVGMLFKIHALFYIGGVLLFLIYHERETRTENAQVGDTATNPGNRWYALFVAALCGLFLLLVALLIRRHLRPMEIVTYLVPIGLLCSVLVISECRCPKSQPSVRIASLSRLSLAFGVGLLVPITIFVAAFASVGALDDVYRGVVVLPQRFVSGVSGSEAEGVPGLKRFVDAVSSHSLPSVVWILPAIPLALVLICGGNSAERVDRRAAPIAAAVFAVVAMALYFVLKNPWQGSLGNLQMIAYQILCFSCRSLLPLVTVGITMMLLGKNQLTPLARQELCLLAVCTNVMSLIQYPYATAIYFFYIAPLVLLTLNAYVAGQRSPPRRTLIVCGLFYLAFGMLWLNTGFNRSHGVRYLRSLPTVALDLPRAGIFVSQRDRSVYEELVRTIQQHSKADAPIFAGPDCPEVYFLSNRKNPTRAFFDFFADVTTQSEKIVQFLEDSNVNLVVINRRPEFSLEASRELDELLARRYPHNLTIDRFLVRWRDPSVAGN